MAKEQSKGKEFLWNIAAIAAVLGLLAVGAEILEE